MRTAVTAGIIFGAYILQTTAAQYVTLWGVKPNLLLILVVSFALIGGSIRGAVVGLAAGLLLDISSGRAVGFYALVGMYLGLVVGIYSIRFFKENYRAAVLCVFLSTILYETFVFLWGLAIYHEPFWNHIFFMLRTIVIEGMYNGVVALLAYPFILGIDGSHSPYSAMGFKRGM